MYRYVTDVSTISHKIIKEYTSNFDLAIDATLGNGYDTDFLSEKFKKVYAFDIQKQAIDSYMKNEKENVDLILDSHENFSKYIKEPVDCIMYNLGFLPGGDKSITTVLKSTIISLEEGIKLLKNNGIITISVYSGHDGGKEKEAVYSFVRNLPKNKFAVMNHEFINRDNNPPSLIVIEKK